MRWVKVVLGCASVVAGLGLCVRASLSATAHEYVATLALALASVAAFRAGVELLARESAE